ncbi:MAG: hypothetical protein IT381_10120 [Deltaproteobacteria bacterium]|nr:hypothetical protein [Deltaproteobacteria bacterium]
MAGASPILDLSDPSALRRLGQDGVDPRLGGPYARPQIDPNAVMSRGTASEVDEEFKALLLTHAGAPRAAEAAAQYLLDKYGPYSLANPKGEAARRAIINHLTWMCGDAIQYNNDRYPSTAIDVQPPNVTINTLKGVCRDYHTAAAAMLAGLMTAEPDGAGGWKLGTCIGQEDKVVASGYGGPDESHAFFSFVDPATQKWNTLEYGKNYFVKGASYDASMLATLHNMSGIYTYVIRGWDVSPTTNHRQTMGSQAVVDFFTRTPTQTFDMSATQGGVWLGGKLTDKAGVSATFQRETMSGRLGGGLMVHVQDTFDKGPFEGRWHLGAGAYYHTFSAAPVPGVRGADDREEYRELVLGLRGDGSIRTKPLRLLDDSVELRLGADADLLLGFPLFNTTRPDPLPVNPQRLGDYSRADITLHARADGHHELTKDATIDWNVWVSARYDLILVGTEGAISIAGGAPTFWGSLVKEPYTIGGMGALTVGDRKKLSFRTESGFVWRPGSSPLFNTPNEFHYVAARAGYADRLSLSAIGMGSMSAGQKSPIDTLSLQLGLSDVRGLSLNANVTAPIASPNRAIVGLGINGRF